MNSLVKQIQEQAINRDVSIVELVQRTLLAATRLQQEATRDWAHSELNGYAEGIDIPEYRRLSGNILVVNPALGGYQPLHFKDAATENRYSKMVFGIPLSEVVDLAGGDSETSDSVLASFSTEVENRIRKIMSHNTKPVLNLESRQFRRITDAVRQAVLNWSLELEKEGISGENMEFTPTETDQAKSSGAQITNHFHGAISDSQVQIGAIKSSQSTETRVDSKVLELFVEAVNSKLDQVEIPDESMREIKSDLSTIRIQAESPNPKSNVVKESLKSIRAILEAASGNVAASGILAEIALILGP